jgi:hypothetical protein
MVDVPCAFKPPRAAPPVREAGFDRRLGSNYPTQPDRSRSTLAREAPTLTDAPSKNAVLQARIAVALIVGLVILGVAWYGVTAESLGRLWRDVLDRPSGPMTFRFILQPAMAIIAALRDGLHDARLGRRPYFWALLHGVRDPQGRSARLWEGIISTARIVILGVVMDTIYQWVVFRTFYPGQAAVIAILLAFIPYLLLRGPFERIAYHWVARPASH